MSHCGQSLSSWYTTTSIWPTNAGKDSAFDRQKFSPRIENAKTKATEKGLFEIRKKNILNRAASLNEILSTKSSDSKDQIKKNYHKTHTDADGGKEFFKPINQAYQILTYDAARKAYNMFGLDEAEKEKVMNDENS